MPGQAHNMTLALDCSDDLELRLADLRLLAKLPHSYRASWTVAPDVDVLSATPEPFVSIGHRRGIEAAWREASLRGDWQQGDRDGIVAANVNNGEIAVRAFAVTPEHARGLVSLIRDLVPEHTPSDPDVIPITFWNASMHGPMSRHRELDAAAWETIESNYPERVRARVDRLMRNFEPGLGGQLLLWHGAAGTGKTTALRTLAREWRSWCDMHYIVDPEAFFGSDANYMLTVMLAAETNPDVVTVHAGIEEGELSEAPRWRVLILEDCGEMLQPDARKDIGQALSRLLNTCDGLIGRGLRLLLLITTNEPLDKLHEAVARPGRCAARVQFMPFSPEEADQWLRDHDLGELPLRGPSHPTLADLYGKLEKFDTTAQERVVGFAG